MTRPCAGCGGSGLACASAECIHEPCNVCRACQATGVQEDRLGYVVAEEGGRLRFVPDAVADAETLDRYRCRAAARLKYTRPTSTAWGEAADWAVLDARAAFRAVPALLGEAGR